MTRPKENRFLGQKLFGVKNKKKSQKIPILAHNIFVYKTM